MKTDVRDKYELKEQTPSLTIIHPFFIKSKSPEIIIHTIVMN